MAKKQQTHAKRAREAALMERRERKQAKKAEVAARRASGSAPAPDEGLSAPETEPHAEIDAGAWIE
jgi:hypothetical protein